MAGGVTRTHLRLRFARQRRVVDAQAVGFDDANVGRHRVAALDLHNVANDERGRLDRLHVRASYDDRHERHHLGKALHRSLRLVVLHERKHGRHHVDNDEHDGEIQLRRFDKGKRGCGGGAGEEAGCGGAVGAKEESARRGPKKNKTTIQYIFGASSIETVSNEGQHGANPEQRRKTAKELNEELDHGRLTVLRREPILAVGRKSTRMFARRETTGHVCRQLCAQLVDRDFVLVLRIEMSEPGARRTSDARGPQKTIRISRFRRFKRSSLSIFCAAPR